MQPGKRDTLQNSPPSRCAVCRSQREQDESASETSTAPRLADPVDSTPEKMPYALISLLAGAGALETAYLTWAKLANIQVACTADGGCTSVLGSDYASVLGIPLPLLGFFAYATVAGLAASGALSSQAEPAQQDIQRRYVVLAGAAVLASCSATLMWVLFTKLSGQSCTWCYASAALSFTIALASTQGFKARELREAALPGGSLVAATVLGLMLAWSGIDPQEAQADLNIPYNPPAVATASSSRSVQLAQRLRDAGARMYGAFWCSHCHDQKELFGKDAMAAFPYVECYPDGYYRGVKLAQPCLDAKIQAFPVWIIGGQQYEGEQSFDKLEAALAKARAGQGAAQLQTAR
ncbi:hypothetical protein WJX72_003961 [[Myrmecia] bisecta]|uniref:Vitamin K epoxide reductase domain-containing protein n=1 Tax=[Myrmecia] bisecta TaxID=41462 RepID=A0AAW1QER1_9CHLO